LFRQIHTPDSSRYWLADSYDERHAAGLEPQNIDKEFLRLWFRERCDPYNDKVSSSSIGKWQRQQQQQQH
jgi:phosphoribosylaminoimidazole-succinocarboxamide synthase